MSPGPFRTFLEGLARIQAHFDAASPVRTALVTARAAPAHYRVVNTLRAWGINIDETYFLGGVDKTEVLKAFGAHIFFDDQYVHAERASAQVPAAQVLWSEGDLPAPSTPAKPVVKGKGKGRDGTRSKAAKAKRSKPAASPRGGARPATPRARAGSER